MTDPRDESQPTPAPPLPGGAAGGVWDDPDDVDLSSGDPADDWSVDESSPRDPTASEAEPDDRPESETREQAAAGFGGDGESEEVGGADAASTPPAPDESAIEAGSTGRDSGDTTFAVSSPSPPSADPDTEFSDRHVEPSGPAAGDPEAERGFSDTPAESSFVAGEPSADAASGAPHSSPAATGAGTAPDNDQPWSAPVDDDAVTESSPPEAPPADVTATIQAAAVEHQSAAAADSTADTSPAWEIDALQADGEADEPAPWADTTSGPDIDVAPPVTDPEAWPGTPKFEPAPFPESITSDAAGEADSDELGQLAAATVAPASPIPTDAAEPATALAAAATAEAAPDTPAVDTAPRSVPATRRSSRASAPTRGKRIGSAVTLFFVAVIVGVLLAVAVTLAIYAAGVALRRAVG